MATDPFFWGARGRRISASEAEENRRTAEALRARLSKPKNMWDGLQNAINETASGVLDWQATEAEEAGRAEFAQSLADAQASGDPDAYMTLLANSEYATGPQSAVAQALLNRAWAAEDREVDWSRQDRLRTEDRDWDVRMRDEDWAHQAPLRDLQVEGAGIHNEAGRLELDRAKQGFTPLVSPEDRAQFGIDPGDTSVWYKGPDNKPYNEGGGKGAGITINTGDNSSKFSHKADELAADRMSTYVTGGNDATNFVGDLEALSSLAKSLETGKGAEVVASLGPFAEAVGIDIAGLGEAQAYEAIVARMAPAMRLPGAGASSDFDARQFLKSLPGLGKSPEGNKLISDTFRGIQDRKIMAADIAQKALRNEITWQEADAQIASLGDPFSAFKAWQERDKSGAVPKQPAESAITRTVGGKTYVLIDGAWYEQDEED